MGSKEKSGGTTTVNQTTTATPAPYEAERNALLFNQEQETMPSQTRNILSGLDLSNLLLTGQQLPGYLGALPGGISEDVTQGLVDRAMNDVNVGSQSAGLLDSGVNASIRARTSGDIRLGSATFNLQNLQQLLNLAVGGQAQPFQAPIAYGQQLGASLAGLRSTSTSGSQQQTNYAMNPFLKSFQTAAGNSLGSFGFGAGPFTFGGR